MTENNGQEAVIQHLQDCFEKEEAMADSGLGRAIHNLLCAETN
jgi:hypothetical protein